jgi:hypothetical protein
MVPLLHNFVELNFVRWMFVFCREELLIQMVVELNIALFAHLKLFYDKLKVN